MDKNTITGFVLIALIFIGFGWYNQPSEEQLAEAAKQDSIAQVMAAQAEKEKAAAVAKQEKKLAEQKADSTALFFPALCGEAKDIVLKNG